MPASEKARLRAAMRSLKQALTPEIKAEASVALWERLHSRPDFRDARTLLLYCALPDEPDTRPLIQELYGIKKLYLPAVTGKGIMELRQYEGSKSLRRGAYGILEPTGTPLTDVSAIDLALIPGVAFTPSGQRLGRGGGFYDRLLSNPAFRARTLGVCFPCQVVPNLPAAPHDRPVSELL